MKDRKWNEYRPLFIVQGKADYVVSKSNNGTIACQYYHSMQRNVRVSSKKRKRHSRRRLSFVALQRSLSPFALPVSLFLTCIQQSTAASSSSLPAAQARPGSRNNGNDYHTHVSPPTRSMPVTIPCLKHPSKHKKYRHSHRSH